MVTGSVSLNVMELSAGNSTFLTSRGSGGRKSASRTDARSNRRSLAASAKPPINAPTAAPPPVTTAVRLPLPFTVPP